MKAILSISLCFVFSVFYAQEARIGGSGTMKPYDYKVDILDTSQQNIYYQTFIVKNPEKPNVKQQTVCILELGKTKSSFMDMNNTKSDSIAKAQSLQEKIKLTDLNAYLPYNSKWNNSMVKDNATKNIIFQEYAKKNFQYEEVQPALNWKLGKENKTILGYKCNQATVEYRGRKYTAWYTTEIPISSGPYVFEGLPGLILEIYDSKDEFHFSTIAMDKIPREIYVHQEKGILKVTRDQFRKANKSYHDNPGFYMNGSVGGAYNADGTEIKVDPKFHKPYNPIELN